MTQTEQPTCALTEAIKPLLPPLLVQVADHRVLEGFRKYGQVLSDNKKPLRKKVVHHIQELLDALNYNEWEQMDLLDGNDLHMNEFRRDVYVAHLWELLTLVPDLTFEELTYKEGHSEADQLRADLAAAQARVAALEAENAALQEQVSLYRLDNEGHMECLTETHQGLLRELPDSETTALLGRILAHWQRTPGQRQYVALSEIEGQAEAAARAGQADRLIREWFAEMVGVEKAEGEYRQDQTLGDALTQAHTRKLRAEIKLATYAAPSAAATFGLTESNMDAALGARQ